MNVSDYIIEYFAKKGIKHVFLVSGGGCMHLVDAIGKNKEVEYVCNHHEQACAMATEGYAECQTVLELVSLQLDPAAPMQLLD